MLKLLFLIDQMQAGGAARVVSILINGFCEKGYDVVLCTDNVNKQVFYPISPDVKIVSLFRCKSSKIFGTLKNILFVRRVIREEHPDIVIAEMSQPALWAGIASWFSKTKVISHDHTTFDRKISFWDDFARKYFYYFTDALVILSNKDKAILGKKYSHKHVIYNPLSFLPVENANISRRKNILCVGRFDVWHVKGFDLIIDIFKRLRAQHCDWTLEFAGTGTVENVNYVKKMVDESGLSDCVVFHGQVKDIVSLYKQTSIFALPSRIEGLPMGLIEAMSQGCACVAFEIGGVTQEIMEDKHSGFIVKDGNLCEFTERLSDLMNSQKLLDTMSKNAIVSSNRFSLPVIIDKWECLFKSLI